jgi:hypothetical protein
VIPGLDPGSGNLPAGVHESTWGELVARYGWTPHRLNLLAGLKSALDALRAAGCRRAYVDGSFVTAKAQPDDFDGCWDVDGVDLSRLDPVLQTFTQRRAAQKQKYGGEMFPADWPADAHGTSFLSFFQRDRMSGHPKGIVAIDLEGMP